MMPEKIINLQQLQIKENLLLMQLIVLVRDISPLLSPLFACKRFTFINPTHLVLDFSLVFQTDILTADRARGDVAILPHNSICGTTLKRMISL